MDRVGDERHRDAEREAEEEAEVGDELELLVADLLEDPVRHLGVLVEVADHHQLDVEDLVGVGADRVGHLADDLGELLLDAGVDPLLTRGGRSLHRSGCSRSMIRSTMSCMSPRAVSRMCSAILSGSSCL